MGVDRLFSEIQNRGEVVSQQIREELCQVFRVLEEVPRSRQLLHGGEPGSHQVQDDWGIQADGCPQGSRSPVEGTLRFQVAVSSVRSLSQSLPHQKNALELLEKIAKPEAASAKEKSHGRKTVPMID